MKIKILRSKINIKEIQYLNIFERVTGIKTNHCFEYDSSVIFAVHPHLINKAIGERKNNIRKLESLINRKVRIIPLPAVRSQINHFIEAISYPAKFKRIIIEDNVVTMWVIPKYKALIIGRNRNRINSLKDILEKYFGIKEVLIK